MARFRALNPKTGDAHEWTADNFYVSKVGSTILYNGEEFDDYSELVAHIPAGWLVIGVPKVE